MSTDQEFRQSVREAVLAILDACERYWSPADPRNATVLFVLDVLETKWFPSELRTSEMRRQNKEARRQGLIK